MRTAVVLIGITLALQSSAHAAPRDFTPAARDLYAVAACGEAPPPGYDAKTITAHCKEVAKITTAWKTRWRDKAAPFFAELLKSGAPSSVVYPFGGGDLSTALAVFPAATDYTTISLEGMGDPRPLAGVAQLGPALGKLRTVLAANLGWAWNTTTQLSIDSSETGAGLPGILGLTLVALEANGYEPLEVRFFQLGADGAITYVTDDDVTAWDARPKTRLTHKADQALQSGLFNDVEIVFRAKGEPNAPKKTFRHIAADLSDGGAPGTFKFLDGKRDFAAITKAASYLLWKPEFHTLRNVLLARMTLMISDDTGIPPRYAKPAGFVQDVWGTYVGAFFNWANRDVAQEFAGLWKGSKGPITFRFGYYDSRRHPHVMLTHK